MPPLLTRLTRLSPLPLCFRSSVVLHLCCCAYSDTSKSCFRSSLFPCYSVNSWSTVSVSDRFMCPWRLEQGSTKHTPVLVYLACPLSILLFKICFRMLFLLLLFCVICWSVGNTSSRPCWRLRLILRSALAGRSQSEMVPLVFLPSRLVHDCPLALGEACPQSVIRVSF